MCERCEEKEKQDQIIKAQSCSACSSGACQTKEPEVLNVNREVIDPETESKRIDEEIKKHHIEIINGYDRQLEECLRDIAKFSTKMLIMFEDYMKKGKTEEMVKLLQSIANYGIMTQTTSTVVITSANMMIEKVRAHV
jgi:hypothetical protein